MTIEERNLICQTVLHSCPTGPPENVHLQIELLSRIVGKSIEEIQAMYSRLSCFNIIAKIKKIENDEDLICKESLVIRVEYRPGYKDLPEIENSTFIIIEIVRIIAENLCSECVEIAWNNLDFSILSTSTGFPELVEIE